MRILYVAMKYDYGRPEQGLGFEHYNFYHSLVHMGHDILYFDYMTLMQKHGRNWMNRRLLEVVRLERPELMLTVLFKDELDPTALLEAKKHTTTINWFCDDHWRFETFSRHWAPCFTWVVTTAASALPKYAALGHRHVIKSQWACNHFLYRRSDLPLTDGVTFVGQPHGNRPQMIEAIRKAGIKVRVWGNGWGDGRIDQDDMIGIFGRSRINLNLSNASIPANPVADHGTSALGVSIRTRLSRALDNTPFSARLKALGRFWLGALNDLSASRSHLTPGNAAEASYCEQIKGRNFEVPGCGGFLLTGRAENLDQYYADGKEIVIFDHPDDLIMKIRYFLEHEDERAAIARAGYERTIREHTYARRFEAIFRQIGLSYDRPGGDVRPGCTYEVV
jgi:spore maturation protein CgeB